jgi:hypothetical protein
MARTPGGNAAIESRLRAAQGLSASDSHALAGFIDAEGSFVIVPNNGGTTWSCGLRGRKRREFEVWREAAHERAFAKVGGRPWDRSRVKAVAERLTALRVYRPPPDPLGATDVSDPRSEARSAYLQVLQAFAAEAPEGELTATTYARARERHPEWPTRNTIAAAFGGWARALEAAGLGSRVTDRARSRARRA